MYTVCVSSLNRSKLPNLMELFIEVSSYKGVHVELPNPETLPRLEYLTLSSVIQSIAQVKQLGEEITKWKLKKLDLSHTPCLGGGNVSTLLSHSFPSLQSLILVDCDLSLKDATLQPNGLGLEHLVKAKSDGRLPELKHLDVSHNALSYRPPRDRVCQSVKCEGECPYYWIPSELIPIESIAGEFPIYATIGHDSIHRCSENWHWCKCGTSKYRHFSEFCRCISKLHSEFPSLPH